MEAVKVRKPTASLFSTDITEKELRDLFSSGFLKKQATVSVTRLTEYDAEIRVGNEFIFTFREIEVSTYLNDIDLVPNADSRTCKLVLRFFLKTRKS